MSEKFLNQNGMQKQASDSVAEEYWKSYFKDSGYGAMWVREIPRRVKAELAKKSASLQKDPNADVTIRPIASVPTASGGQSLEALAVLPDKSRVAFVVDFDKDGKVLAFETFTLPEVA